MKQDVKYGLNLTVKKVSVIYSGDYRFPFCCDILTVENSYFRCAVKNDDLATFLLAKEGDELFLTLVKIYEESSVMGVCSCQNPTHSPTNLETYIRQNISNTFSFDVAKTFVMPMPFVMNSGSTTLQDKYYCMMADNADRYIAFETEAKNIPHLVSALNGDTIEFKFYAFSPEDKLELIYFRNCNRTLTDINQQIYILDN